MGGDLFAFGINYNTPTHGGAGLYNGNISETEWRTANTDSSLKWYRYGYDPLNRITGATDNTGNYNVSNIGYDKNGNIQSLTRNGWQDSSNFTNMDVLDYDYDGGNKLTKVTDGGNGAHGFKDGTNTNDDFEYDENGNMTMDLNKGIQTDGISYNYLNLPTNIVVSSAPSGTISYIYDAMGTKLEKTFGTTTTHYAGNYIYENNKLQFFNHEEGYVTPKDGNDYSAGFDYVYQYRDHMGNVRLSYSDADNDGDVTTNEIIEENSYYPFGLKHQGYNNNINPLGNSNAQKWKYQGQELTEDLGLNTYEFKYRMHDPAIGRFWQIDPLAEDYMYNSTYAFQENKLGIGIELEGLEVSRHEWLDDNGQNNIRYDAQIKVLNSSSASIDQVINYATNIAGQIEKDFSGSVILYLIECK